MQRSWKRLAVWAVLAGIVAAGGTALSLGWTPLGQKATAQVAPRADLPRPESREDDPVLDNGLPVKVVHPKRNDKELVRSVSQPATIRGLYRAELLAHVAGPVKYIEKNIGDSVKQGEVLLELDVPDLVEAVKQKATQVSLAEQELKAAEAYIKVATAREKQARADIRDKEGLADRSEALVNYRRKEYERFRTLVENNGAVAGVADERKHDYEAAEADWKSAKAAVDAARAAAEEFSAKLLGARVDVEVKQARVAVARAEQAMAQATLDYAKIRAPFDGVIVSRDVDPGSFVQNASTGHATPVLTVVRTDVVTAVMWVPEKEAPYVTKQTEVVLHMDALDDREIHSRVTRKSDFLDPTKSRDMRVEVDIPNKDGLLKPGMYGTMTLLLEKFQNACLVPAGAVFERDRKMYVFEVRDGKARLVPVRVQLEDGVEAKVVRLVRRHNPQSGRDETVPEELTGKEEIILSGQGELADGQAVAPVRADW